LQQVTVVYEHVAPSSEDVEGGSLVHVHCSLSGHVSPALPPSIYQVVLSAHDHEHVPHAYYVPPAAVDGGTKVAFDWQNSISPHHPPLWVRLFPLRGLKHPWPGRKGQIQGAGSRRLMSPWDVRSCFQESLLETCFHNGMIPAVFHPPWNVTSTPK
jgi:hypothetical protein